MCEGGVKGNQLCYTQENILNFKHLFSSTPQTVFFSAKEYQEEELPKNYSKIYEYRI